MLVKDIEIVIGSLLVVKLKEIVNKAEAILVVKKNIPFIYAPT